MPLPRCCPAHAASDPPLRLLAPCPFDFIPQNATNTCSSDAKLERLSGVKGRLLLGDKDVAKIIVVRNPIVRILSAFLYARKARADGRS